MAKSSVCIECGQSLVKGKCVNRQCSQNTEDEFASLVPDEIVSMDPSQIVDYTGTLGVNPVDVESVFDDGSVDEDDDSAKTRMVDDDFYKQIREFFPADDSGSKSAEPGDDSRSGGADASRSLSLQGVRKDFSIDEFVPPVRDIRFPSDTASLEQLRAMDPESIAGDEYHIIEKLGEGGYGVVFEAEQVALNRPVAVKVLKPKRKKPGSKSPSRSGTGTGELQRRRDQFLHEAKITARLQHPNIVPLYDFGINTQGQLFYSMKKVERRPWSSVIQNTAKLLGVSEAELDASSDREAINKNVEIFDRVCDAMAYSHAQRIIHRDLKPDNIMIGDYGEVLLIDFGMALDFSVGQPEFSAGGTLVYMAPEMAEHFAKQKEIQLMAQKTAQKLGVDLGSVFLDQSNLMGIGKLAQELIQQSKDQGVVELAETLVRLDAEERGLASKIGYASDIYLLGAILYQIAVGHPPHYFPIGACKQGRKEKFQKELWLALRNGFQQYQEVTDPLRISLRNIAVKAMRTDPANRFQSVEELQEAITGFQLEVQSLEMTETGKEELAKSKGGTGYSHLLPALESFRGAGALWPESEEAKSLQVETACEYATRASSQKDFDAGLSILDEYVFQDEQQAKPVVEVRKKLVDGKKRRARNRKLAWASSIAAVVLPVGFFVVFTAMASVQGQKLAASNTQLEEKKKEVATAVLDVANAKQELERVTVENIEKLAAAKEKSDKEIEAANQEATDAIKEADKKSKFEIAEAKKASDDQIETARKASEAKVALAEKEANTTVQLAKAQAEIEVQRAGKLAADAKAKAEKFAFDAELGIYNSNVLTIPLDLRTDKLGEVARKLKQLRESNAKSSFKNGWAVKHFSKRASVAGTIIKLAENTGIVDIVAVPGSTDSIIVSLENRVGVKQRQPAVWTMKPSGETSKLDVTLPAIDENVEITDMSISSNGQWLAFAINNVVVLDNKPQEHLWVINVKDGTRAELAGGEGVVGCRVVEFDDSSTSLQLVTVEELLGDFGLINRVQVVRRSIVDGALSEGKVTPVPATTRDLGRVGYRADAHWSEGQPTIGLAYQTLDKSGQDVFQLETLTPDGDSGLRSSRTQVPDFPTAIHVDANQKLICGFTDGSIDRFDAADLALAPSKLNNLNENEVVRLESAEGGRLVSGSENGALIIRNADDSLFKKLQGQPGQLSALTIGQTDLKNGFTMSSGDKDGYVRFWQPETNLHDATIRKNSPVTITCGTVDVGPTQGKAPASAFGTIKGQVYYFSSDAMLNRKGAVSIGDSNERGSATFGFQSPFESFDLAFNDFDSIGIVGDHFVLLKDDGTFFRTIIDENRKTASDRSKSQDLVQGQPVVEGFIPLMASVPDQDYFFTTDPLAGDKLLAWKKSGTSFTNDGIDLDSTSRGRIKRMRMSPDGNWLAVVRDVVREGQKVRFAGEYVAEIYDVSSGTISQPKAGSTDVFRVGDPAFVGFSPDSLEMILHFHKPAPDRWTYVERWELTGKELAQQTWARKGKPQKISESKAELVDWERGANVDKMITKVNKKHFLVSPVDSDEAKLAPEDFQISVQAPRERLRTVRPTGYDNKYFVLSSNRLKVYTGTADRDSTEPEGTKTWVTDARDLRVFGKWAVMLDQNGFHLIDSDGSYITKLAARETSVKSLSLSNGRLAILYSNDLCRIWDVRGERPAGLGKIENTQSVKLSPDGKWAVCQLNDSLQVFSIGSKFDKFTTAIAGADVAFDWIGGPASKLLVAANVAGNVNWRVIDPVTGLDDPGAANLAGRLPKNLDGVLGFEVAPKTGNYIAIESKSEFSVWAIAAGKPPVRLNKADHEFDDSKLNKIESFSFSELGTEGAEDMGTRLVVLASDGPSVAEPRIYLLASDEPADSEAGELANQARYRVVEIEGALEKREGRNLIDCEFSGDGKSLFQVDEKGISVLLTD